MKYIASRHSSQLHYDKDLSRILCGVAILLMFIHHFFGFPVLLKEGVAFTPIFSKALLLDIAAFSKLCVGIYAFNTGYAMWAKPEGYTFAKVTRRICHFLLRYWVVCFLFLFYTVLVGDKLPPFKLFLFNLVGLKVSYFEFVSCCFAWYVYFYIIVLLLAPILLYLFKCKGGVANCAIAVGITGCTWGLFRLFPNEVMSDLWCHLSSVLMGLLACKFNVFQTVDRWVKPRPAFFYIVLILGMAIARKYLYIDSLGFNQDAVWVVVFIYSILGVFRNGTPPWLERLFSFLGKYSMNMWFVHPLFFTGSLSFLQEILYFPRYPIFIFLWGIILVLPMAMLCTYIQERVFCLIQKESGRVALHRHRC